jgi:hypothetical protein
LLLILSAVARNRPLRKCLLRVPLQTQPTDTSCGPTCLQAVYAYYGDEIPLRELMTEVGSLETGGTFATMLGLHALQRGYKATIYTFNLRVFDPTWFPAKRKRLLKKLHEQVRVRHGKRRLAAQSYVEFLERGGELRFEDLTGALIRRYLRRQQPILTGLSATFLYRCPREIPETCADDDVNGEPLGHFVILSGYDSRRRLVSVADPFEANPLSADRSYEVSMERLINAILLGVLTYDGNLLMVRP